MMDRLVLSAFGEELRDKLAVSAAKSLAAIQRRVAQGARVAPSLLSQAEHAAASGMAATPRAVRLTAMGAADAAKTQQLARGVAQRAGPSTAATAAATRSRLEGAMAIERANPAAVRTGQPLSAGYEGYMTDIQRGYSPEHKALAAPQQQTLPQVARATKNARPYSWASGSAQSGPVTAVGRPPRQPVNATAHTTLAPAPAGMGFEPTQLAPAPSATPISGIRPAASGTNPGIAARRARRPVPNGAAA